MLPGHANAALGALDRVTREAIEARRADVAPRAQIIARVVPGAAHDALGDDPFSERTAVVRAVRRDRQDLCAMAHQDHLLAAHMPQEGDALLELFKVDPVAQIRSLQFFALCSTHYCTPCIQSSR